MKSKALFGRTSRLIKLTASLAARELAIRLIKKAAPKLRLDQAREIALILGQLKGAAMKAGQLASIELRDYLPREAIEILAKLQDSADPVDFEQIQSMLRDELGPQRIELVQKLDPKPLASASIGQVHRAHFKGEEIALKVQYRGIEESIDSDVALIARIAGILTRLTSKEMNLEGTFDEIKTVLKQEADYLTEANNLERYRTLIAQLPGYRVPRHYPEITTRRVLAMSFEHGERLWTWAESALPEARQEIATKILRLYFYEFFEWGLVQTDPNPANFLVVPQTLELVVLDFGAVKEYTTEFRQLYRQLILATLSDDESKMRDSGVALQWIDPRESQEVWKNLFHVLRTALEPLLHSEREFEFDDPNYDRRVREAVFALARSIKHSPPPRQLLFLHRKLGGIHSILKKLKARRNLSEFKSLLLSH